MQAAIDDLIQLGAINLCEDVSGQFLSSYFLVTKLNGDKRFILNLKNLNKTVKAPHFKMEDYRSVSRLLQENWYMCSIDLKNAYFLISVDSTFRKFCALDGV